MKNFKTQMKKCALALMLGAFVCAGSSSAAVFYIDFGGVNGDPVSNPDSNGNTWNNATDNSANSTLALVDSQNNSSGISIQNNSTFGQNGIGAGGLLAPSAGLLGNFAIANATEDYWFTTSGTGISIDFSGLLAGAKYSFELFGTRETTSTRVTEYQVTAGNGTFTTTLQTSGENIGNGGIYDGNNDTLASFSNLTADGSGEINLRLRVSSGGFAYLGLAQLTESVPEPSSLALLLVGAAGCWIMRRKMV